MDRIKYACAVEIGRRPLWFRVWRVLRRYFTTPRA